MSSLSEIIELFPSIRIVVIGDVIFDHYIFGDSNRISPEAPVPVVEVKYEDFRLGGAANTVANIRSLGGQVSVISIVGKDENGNRLRKMLFDIGANVDGLFEDGGRPTIIKTRVIARNQQLVRIDRELRHQVDDNLKDEIIHLAEALIPTADAIIFSDYDKGVVSKDIFEVVSASARANGIPVVVDPKERNFWNYKGATIVTPNLKEAGTPLGITITDNESLLYVGNILLERLELDALLITRGEHGMSLFEANRHETNRHKPSSEAQFPTANGRKNKVTHIPTVAREVFDVTGAGDTVVAVFTSALAAGADMLDAAIIANCAAGIVVGKIGTASVTKEELMELLKEIPIKSGGHNSGIT